MNQDTLIFLHISKTGGTTLRSIIGKQYPPEQIYDLDPSYFVSNSSEYEATIQKRVAALKALSNEQKRQFRCFFHPTAYGLHEILPFPVHYATMLRDPIDHYISSFYFAVNEPGHVRHQAIMEKELTMDSFLDYFNVDNLQTRRLSACDPIDALHNVQYPLPDNALELAKQNLSENIAIFGLMEYFDESVLMMQERFGWKDVAYFAKNVAKKRRDIHELNPQTRSRLETMLENDLALYEYAHKLFRKRMQESEIDWDRSLAQLHKRNRQLLRWRNTKRWVRKFVDSVARKRQ